LVDSGATYTLLPQKVWRAIGLQPMDSIKCVLVDGTEVERKVSECQIALPQGRRHTPVMLKVETPGVGQALPLRRKERPCKVPCRTAPRCFLMRSANLMSRYRRNGAQCRPFEEHVP